MSPSIIRSSNLAHAGTARTAGSSTSTRTQTGTARLAEHDDRDDHGGRVSGPGEEEEGDGGLGFTAASLAVDGAVGDFVVEGVFLHSSISTLTHTCMYQILWVETYTVATVPTLQFSRKGNPRSKKENGVQGIQHNHDNGVAGPVDVDRGRDEIEQCEQGEGGRVHGIVDRPWVAGEGIVEHVTDEGHDEDAEYELVVLVSWCSRRVCLGETYLPRPKAKLGCSGGHCDCLSSRWVMLSCLLACLLYI